MRFEKAPNGLCVVSFIKSWRQYNTGTVAGFKEEDARRICKQGYAEPYRSVPASAVGADTGADGNGTSPVEKEIVEIPEGFESLHHNKIIAIAKKLDASVDSKADAVAVINAELARRSEEAGNAGEGDSDTKEDEVPDGGSETDGADTGADGNESTVDDGAAEEK